MSSHTSGNLIPNSVIFVFKNSALSNLVTIGY